MSIFKRNKNYNTRKIHRYLGVFIGIQFLMWTLGGLYFSWNNMDDVHGETLIKAKTPFAKPINFEMIQKGVDSLKTAQEFDNINNLQFIEVLNQTYVLLTYFVNDEVKSQLIVAENGALRKYFSEEECLQMVQQQLKNPIPIIKQDFITLEDIGNHHEYRGKPLPAYVFTLDHSTNTNIYVAVNTGQITSVRNDNWRRFDFLWMLHTMDYSTRDHITNWILRIFSVLGLGTVLSGFYLFYLTSPIFNKKHKRNRRH